MPTTITVSINGDVNYPLDLVRAAMSAPSEFADVRLVETAPGGPSDIYVVDLQQLQDAFGLPGEFGGLAVDLRDAGVGYAGLDIDRVGALDPLAVATHEIVGHLVAGLADRQWASRDQTIMTYANPRPRLQADDIAALQQLYGAPATDDVMMHGAGNGAMSGGLGNDILYGNQGSDHLYGNQGADTLYGGSGDDWLHGGQGDDWLAGGIGADTIAASAGHDTAAGFDGAGGDRIHAMAGVSWSLADGTSGAVLAFSNGHSLTLIGVRVQDFSHEWVL